MKNALKTKKVIPFSPQEALAFILDNKLTKQLYIYILVIDPDNITELSSVLLACTSFKESHTADNLASFLKNTAAEWGLSQRMTIVVSDNAANI